MVLLGLDSALKRCIFSGYVGLWVSCHILVYSSKQAGAPPYNATSVVLITELTKLVLALGLFVLYDGGLAKLLRDVRGSRVLLAKYAAPAMLYCVYNNLVYLNLATFDPGTYNVLMQLRIVLTGVLYQLLFARSLNRNQWRAIFLITAGCVVKESSKLAGGALQANLWSWALLLLQMLCSVFAGVYNELLLKGGDGSGAVVVSTNLQNAYMYLNSIVCNAAFLLLQDKLHEALASENIRTVFAPRLLAVIAIMSTVGLVTGFFLKHLDSVLKSIASALEVVLTTALSWLFFGTPLDVQTLVAAGLVGVGVTLYSRPTDQVHEHYVPVRVREDKRDNHVGDDRDEKHRGVQESPA